MNRRFRWRLDQASYVLFVLLLGFVLLGSSLTDAFWLVFTLIGVPALAKTIGLGKRRLPAQTVRQALSPIKEIPTVSLVLPFFNSENYLEQAISSALSSENIQLELLLVDDASTDRSLDIARKFARDKRVKILTLEQNHGVSFARNLAILESRGDYVAFIDSDDVHDPDRISRQISALESSQDTVGSLCLAQRWNPEMTSVVSAASATSVSLVVKRRVFHEIGYFDSVRWGGDYEFRMRLFQYYGPNALVVLKEHLYKLRTRPGSLTRAEESRLYYEDHQGLKLDMGSSRTTYLHNFQKWHTSASKEDLRLAFPQRTRPFALGSDAQSGSPAIGQRVIGSVATQRSRLESLEQSVASIAQQVDELHVYCNDFAVSPDFLSGPKIVNHFAPIGDIKDTGKFFGLSQQVGYLFTLDDDIIYPPDYVSRMIGAIERSGRKKVFGIHGVNFDLRNPSYLKRREVFEFWKSSPESEVHLLGTGTVAFHTDALSPKIHWFESNGLADLWFAKQVHIRNLVMATLSRPRDWLTQVPVDRKKTLYTINSTHQRRPTEALFAKHLLPLLQSYGAVS